MLMSTITKRINIKISSLLIGLLALPSLLVAADFSASTRSISYSSNAPMSDSTKKIELQQADTHIIPKMLADGYRSESGPVEKSLVISSSNKPGDFSIYNVTTNLIRDDDYMDFIIILASRLMQIPFMIAPMYTRNFT